MRAIELDRAQGKTTALVKEMLKPGNEDMIFVAPTKMQAINIGYRTALGLGAPDTPALKSRFVSWQGGINQFKGRQVRLLVDEADGILSSVFGAPVHLLAYTPEDE